jgi:Saccharopine dehydrogenase NADP binding domain
LDGPSLEADVKRVIVLGGRGLFGRTAIAELESFGIRGLMAGRHPTADLSIDANDSASIKAVLLPGDLVVDTAGPFQRRSMALLQSAIEIGFDVIDINDNLHYAEQVIELENKIDSAGIRVLSSASSVSAVAATMLEQSGINHPRRVTAFLAPASRHTANPGSALSLIQSVGRQVRTFREGQLQSLRGWTQPHRFPMPKPLGPICGRLFESADVVYLPRIWPSLREVEMYVDTNTFAGNSLLNMAARFQMVCRLMERNVNFATRISRVIGSRFGGIGYEIESLGGKIVRAAAVSAENSFLIAVAPAVLAARAIYQGEFNSIGLVLPHRHVSPDELGSFLKSRGIAVVQF